MDKRKLWRGLGAAAALGGLVVAGMYWAGSSSGTVPAASVDFNNLPKAQYEVLYKRGEQVFRAADCAACHSSPSTGAELAGGMAMLTPMGTLYGTNISPSKEYGLGQWSADDFYRALVHGMAPGRKNLYPAMPYTSYHQMTRGDVDALWIWLKAQPAMEVPNQVNAMNFPFNIRPAVALWNALERPNPAPASAEAAGVADGVVDGSSNAASSPANELARGQYLVNGLGHCGECHTPRTTSFAMDLKRPLAGAVIEGAYAPDLTPQALAARGWTQADLQQFLRTGLSDQGVMTFGMFPVLEHSSSKMPEADLKAMAAYLTQNQPMPGPQPKAPQTALPVNGQRIYLGLCAGCHGANGEGQPHSSVRLDVNTTAMFPTPLNLIRVIREGVAERDLAHGERMQAMPGFAQQLSDAEVADLVNYLRMRWGGQPGDVTASQVAREIKAAAH